MSDRTVVVVAVAVVIGAFAALPVPAWFAALAAVLAVVIALVVRPRSTGRWTARLTVGAGLAALVLTTSARADASLAALAAPLPSTVDGVAQLVTDPERRQFGVTAVLSIEGRRYVATVTGAESGLLLERSTGEHVVIRGRTAPLRGAPPGWVRSRHLAGRLSVSTIRAGPPASMPMRVANGVRSLVISGADSFTEVARPQYLGMVVGDDRGQHPVTEFRFRASGLTHLLVVSGQNVAFVLLVAAPALRYLPRRSRTVATIAVIALFVLVTRADPSVLRAATMAGIGVLAVASGRVAPAARVLGAAVVVLVLADPLIVHSLGFQLSVAATAGLMIGVGRLAPRLRLPEPVALPLAATLSAQVATAPLLLATSGWLSPSAPLTNLLAAPGSAMVMMLGATVGLFAGLVDERLAAVLQVPARVGVWSVDAVAAGGSRLPLAALTPMRSAWLVLCAGTALMVGSSALAHRRRWCVASAVLAAAALVPSAVGPGAHRVTDGVVLVVGNCGGTVVVLDGAGESLDVLEALWVDGLRSADAVVVGSSRLDARVAAAVREQFGARRVVFPGDGPRLVDALTVRWGPSGQPEVSETSCTVAR